MQAKPLSLLPTPKDKEKLRQVVAAQKQEETKAGRPAATTKQADKKRKMSLTLEDGMIVIRLPVFETPTQSASGKSKLYGTTRGPKRVMHEIDGKLEHVEIDGGYLKATASAYVTLDSKKKQTV